MITKIKGLAKCATGALVISLLAGPAMAQGLKDGPAMAPERALAWSGSFAVTNDYVFRGFSQSAERGAVQGTVEVTYGIAYANAFLSNIDFGETLAGRNIAPNELTFAAGFKPVMGPITFDFGVIYYTYPSARDAGGELNFVELKAGASFSPWKGGTIGLTGYYSPDYTGETGRVWTVEGSIAHELSKMGIFTPTVSALVGFQKGDSLLYSVLFAGGDDSYTYWNAGVSLAFHERFSIDLRYWGTSNSDGFCNALGRVLNCDDRFSATAKVTF